MVKRKKCPTGTRKSKSGKTCRRKPIRYKLNFSLIYGRRKKKKK